LCKSLKRKYASFNPSIQQFYSVWENGGNGAVVVKEEEEGRKIEKREEERYTRKREICKGMKRFH
jgi:hypothetical protein